MLIPAAEPDAKAVRRWGWLPSCLTRRSYSKPRGIAAHCLQAPIMQAPTVKTNRRRQDRIQAVLPVRVRGTDSSGKAFEILAHTLDLTANGARLGSIRHQLKALDTLTIFYRQRKMEFTVVWTKLLDGRGEYTATEFRLLDYFARHLGRVFSRDHLLDSVWRDTSYVTPRSVDVYVRRIRENRTGPGKPPLPQNRARRRLPLRGPEGGRFKVSEK